MAEEISSVSACLEVRVRAMRELLKSTGVFLQHPYWRATHHGANRCHHVGHFVEKAGIDRFTELVEQVWKQVFTCPWPRTGEDRKVL
jgi:hypothetical protein